MKPAAWKRRPVAALALGAAVMAGISAPGDPAQAINNHGAIDHPGVTLTAAGSDTTEEFMARYLSSPANGDVNLPAKPAGPIEVAGDAACPTRTYTGQVPPPAGQHTAPNGSLSAIDALLANAGCIDIARVSHGPRFDEGPDLNFWAYAMDYVSWATPSLHAPSSLTLAQVRGIYSCSVTDWSQVGGIPGPIRPFLPQAGSGVTLTFVTEVLGPATTIGPCVDRTIQPNTGRDPALTDADYQGAILPYSTSQWIFQDINKANPALDLRNGVHLGGLSNVCSRAGVSYGALYNGAARRWLPNAAPSSTAPLITEQSSFNALVTDGGGCGSTFVANVTHAGDPNQAVAEQHVGQGSELCTGAAAAQLAGVGLVALPTGPGLPVGTGVGTCRRYAT